MFRNKDYEKQFANHICPKCRGRSFAVSKVSLASLPKKLIMGRNDTHYLLVTCGLCGYTEMYNLQVLARLKEEAPINQTSPVIEKME
ncbi:MAG: hypothetical protein C4527_14810 [Candidatus Omnitrophota bacterium]|jgi:predicted nucleic-acid-binding Zn-ribbon protein|nr:MAG: hypothetical protein C4527_14810 [Candidatus Omnitrophota bacterium]